MSLWVPPTVSPDLRDSTLQHAAEVEQQGRIDEVCERFNRELYHIDEYLRMRFFDEGTTVAGAVPGRYHLVRRAPDSPATLISITGPQGEFVEPGYAVFDKLAEGDMWNSRAMHERRRAQEAAERASKRQQAREAEERQEELKDRWNAATRTWVSMDRSAPWTQNASPTARRDAGRRRRG